MHPLPLLAALLLLQLASPIELELNSQNNFQACTVLLSSFDPVNVELKFPAVPNKQAQETFSVKLSLVKDPFHQTNVDMGDNMTYRNSYKLDRNTPYNLCINFNPMRDMASIPPIYIGYTAIQDFQHLIGQVQVPPELASEGNLKTIYHIAGEVRKVSSIIKGHQQKQRKIEDEIATRNVHKEKRVVTLGLVEICVILLCGVYQVFALRKFLIEKNLY